MKPGPRLPEMALVDLNIQEPGWEGMALGDLCEDSARAALRAAGLGPEGFEISVLACDNGRIAELNLAFRGKAGATNVLSWPAMDLAPDTPGAMPQMPSSGGQTTPCFLGDVAIALQTTRSEAAERAIPLKNHISHLILHGCLHLLGFDHETDADADVMEGLETGALATMGISDPYE
ncbi:MAG: rRNA maturation RNase YbeY [Pseudomonadota bacterium]